MIRTLLLSLPLALSPLLASAHAGKEATTPADGETVEAVEAIVLRFDGPMRIIALTLTAEDGEVGIERETGMDPVSEFRATPAAPLMPGPYRLDWRGMAEDGHPMQGGFGFTVAE